MSALCDARGFFISDASSTKIEVRVPIDSWGRSKQEEQIYAVFEKLSILGQARKNLCTTLAMAQVGYLIPTRAISNIIKKCWLIVSTKLLEAPVPEFRVVLRI